MALRAITEALSLQPDDPDYHELLSSIQYEREDFEGSLEQADRGLEYDSQHVGCLYRRALALYTFNRKRDAEAVFRTILTIDAEHAPSQGFIGHLEVGRGRYAAALPLLRHALQETPDWTLVRVDWIIALRGQYLYYGVIARLKQWAYEKYKLRSFAVLNLIVALVMLLFHGPEMHGLDNIIGCLILGFPLTCVILLLGLPLISFYLGVVSRILLFRDRELRRTFSWRESFKENWTLYCLVIYLAFLFLLFLFLSVVK
jgi:tetratricopeptide (TPR) repeat protein